MSDNGCYVDSVSTESACPRCAGRLEIIAFIAEASIARRILEHLGLDAQGPPIARARPDDPAVAADQAPDYGAADPTCDD